MVSTSLMVDTSSHPRAQLHRYVERSAYYWKEEPWRWDACYPEHLSPHLYPLGRVSGSLLMRRSFAAVRTLDQRAQLSLGSQDCCSMSRAGDEDQPLAKTAPSAELGSRNACGFKELILQQV